MSERIRVYSDGGNIAHKVIEALKKRRIDVEIVPHNGFRDGVAVASRNFFFDGLREITKLLLPELEGFYNRMRLKGLVRARI